MLLRVRSQNSRLLHPESSVIISGLRHGSLDAADVVGHLVDDGALRPPLRMIFIPLLLLLEPFDEAVLDLSDGSTKRMEQSSH